MDLYADAFEEVDRSAAGSLDAAWTRITRTVFGQRMDNKWTTKARYPCTGGIFVWFTE